MLEIISKHLDDFSNGRWDDYKSALAENVVYEELATRMRAQGRDDYVAAVRRWKKGFPDLKATILRGFESGDQVVAEIEWEGTNSGPLEGPFGTIQATGQRGKTRAALVCTVEDGKITETRHYFDVLTVLSQLGVAPGLPAMAQPAAKAAEAVKH